MTYQDDKKTDEMGALHNQLVDIVDATPLSPTETMAVFRMIVNYIEKLFEISVKKE